MEKEGHPCPILALVVILAPMEGVWRFVSIGSYGMRPIFVFVGVVRSLTFLIYNSHH
jgi:hypothetical protein